MDVKVPVAREGVKQVLAESLDVLAPRAVDKLGAQGEAALGRGDGQHLPLETRPLVSRGAVDGVTLGHDEEPNARARLSVARAAR